MRICGLRRSHNLLHIRARHSVSNVLRHCAMKEMWVLQHHANLTTVVTGIDRAKINAVDTDVPPLWIVEPSHEIGRNNFV